MGHMTQRGQWSLLYLVLALCTFSVILGASCGSESDEPSGAAVASSHTAATDAPPIIPGPPRVLPSDSPDTPPGSATMQQARGIHSASLLSDGSVLVVGGLESRPTAGGSAWLFGALTQAEIYDPVSGTWSSAGSTSYGRSLHSATVLSDGTVMVTGGGEFAGFLPEVYDPDSGLWSGSSAMDYTRIHHSAVTMSDGRVLVAGGYIAPRQTVSKAEMYDPFTDSWTATGDMKQRRATHATVALADGRVLVIGGYSIVPSVVRTAELYDPTREAWVEAGEPVHARAVPVAVRLADGRVLVAGGYGQDDAGELRSLASAEVYDPSSGVWSPTGSMAFPRVATLTLLEDGRVLAVGVFGKTTGASVEVYDPVTGTWSVGASLSQGRDLHTATLLRDGRVFVAGGFGFDLVGLDSVEIYDPSSD